MSDTPGTLEERLRSHFDDCPPSIGDTSQTRPLLTEAADEIASLRARVEVMREALVDLMSWFPEKPSDPEWRIKGGKFGADDAVEHARSLVEKEPAT